MMCISLFFEGFVHEKGVYYLEVHFTITEFQCKSLEVFGKLSIATTVRG